VLFIFSTRILYEYICTIPHPSIFLSPSNCLAKNANHNETSIAETGCWGLYGFETSRLPCFLHNWLTGGGNVSVTLVPAVLPPSPQEVLWCPFLLIPQGHSATGKIKSVERLNDTGNQTRYLPTSSMMSQPTILPYTTMEIILSHNAVLATLHCFSIG
jgi:hypothetical protein